jgi:hypothetical protein
LGTLTEASTTIASVNGKIKVAINRKGKKLTVTVNVPDGTSCEVVFPNGKSKQLMNGLHTVEGSY